MARRKSQANVRADLIRGSKLPCPRCKAFRFATAWIFEKCVTDDWRPGGAAYPEERLLCLDCNQTQTAEEIKARYASVREKR